MVSASIIEAKYKRAGLNVKNTFLWSQLSDNQKKAIQDKVVFSVEEQCVIVYYRSLSYSWTITNLRLIIFTDNNVTDYTFDKIKGAKFPDAEEIKNNKKEIDQLTLHLVNGNDIVLYVENTTWHFIYGLLKFLLP